MAQLSQEPHVKDTNGKHKDLPNENVFSGFNDKIAITVESEETIKLRNNDVVVATFPRSGTTWTLEIVRNIHLVQNPDLPEQHPLRNKHHPISCPMIRIWPQLVPGINPPEDTDLVESRSNNSQYLDYRTIKTHDRYTDLNTIINENNSKLKIIHVMRDPKDVLFSVVRRRKHIHNCRDAKMFAVRQNNTAELFFEGKSHKRCRSVWDFNKEYLENIHGYNILYLTYEGLTIDKHDNIQKINEFLGYPKLSNDQLEAVDKETTFEAMVGVYHTLKGTVYGKVGKSLDVFDDNMIARFNERTRHEYADFLDRIPKTYYQHIELEN